MSFPKKVKLSKPITIDGVNVASLEMREPTVLDFELSEKEAGSSKQGIILLSQCLGITPDEVRQMGMKDFSKLSQEIGDFLDSE